MGSESHEFKKRNTKRIRSRGSQLSERIDLESGEDLDTVEELLAKHNYIESRFDSLTFGGSAQNRLSAAQGLRIQPEHLPDLSFPRGAAFQEPS